MNRSARYVLLSTVLLVLVLGTSSFGKHSFATEFHQRKDSIYNLCTKYTRNIESCKKIIESAGNTKDVEQRNQGILAIGRLGLHWSNKKNRHYINNNMVFDLLLTVLFEKSSGITNDVYKFMLKNYNPLFVKEQSSKILELHKKYPERYWALKIYLPKDVLTDTALNKNDVELFKAKNGNVKIEQSYQKSFVKEKSFNKKISKARNLLLIGTDSAVSTLCTYFYEPIGGEERNIQIQYWYAKLMNQFFQKEKVHGELGLKLINAPYEKPDDFDYKNIRNGAKYAMFIQKSIKEAQDEYFDGLETWCRENYGAVTKHDRPEKPVFSY